MIHLSNGKGNVYFIEDGDYIKIGVTNNVAVRMKELQTGNPNRLECVFTLITENMKEAHKLEAMLHRKFAHCRIRDDGEWFDKKTVMRWLNHPRLHVGDYTFHGMGSYRSLLKWIVPVVILVGIAVALKGVI